jgi:hypothetical protein
MSAGQVDILVKAREDAISTLQAVQAEIRATGTVSEETRQAYVDTRAEVMLSQRSITTLTMAYREQYESIYLAGRAFSDIASIISRVTTMYTEYNVAMIRQDTLQNTVTADQQKYNAAVAQFGPQSTQALTALKELTTAQSAYADSQNRTNALLLSFAVQIPGFTLPILNTVIAFKTLAVYMTATGTAAAESAGGFEAQAGAALADAAAVDVTTASMTAFDVACAASIVGLAALAGGIAVYGLYLQTQYQPAVWQTTQSMTDLKTAFASHKVIVIDATSTEQAHTEAVKAAALALQQQVTAVLQMATGQIQQTAATKELTAEYANGTLTMEQFATAMLKAGLDVSQVATIIENTVSVSKTALQNFVAQATTDANAFKNAWTGPLAQLGPLMSSTLATMTADTNAAITSGLIGQAQSLFAQFTSCISGKMYDLPGMQDKVMNDLVSITNNAINKDLKGTAQQGIADFVKCATSKQLAMVQEIDGYLQTLQAAYASNNDSILALTKQGKDDEAQIYVNANSKIKDTIDQLKTWRDSIVTGKPLDITVTAKADTTAAEKSISDLLNPAHYVGMHSMTMKGAGTGDISFTASVDTTAAITNITALKTAIASISTAPVVITISVAGVQDAITAFATLRTYVINVLTLINEIPEEKKFTLQNNLDEVITKLGYVVALIASIQDKIVTITVIINYVTTGSTGAIGSVNWGAGAIGSVNWGAGASAPQPGLEPALIPTIGGHYQFGGIVPEDMLAYVHKGEEVVPANKVAASSSTPSTSTINLNIKVSGTTMTDLQFADQVGRQIAKLNALRAPGGSWG